MSTTIEAAHPMFVVGEIVGTLGIPALGLVLLIIGIIQRSRSNAATPQYPYPPQTPPGYPPPGYSPPPGHYPPPGYAPPGYPQQGYPQQGYPSPQFSQPQPGPYPYQPPAAKRGTALMVIGGLLLAFGLLGILGRAATHTPSSHSSSGMAPTSYVTR